MRKLLLASVALGVAAYLPSAAQAQSPTFPTTTTSGKLDGAAPGSVTVSLGFTLQTSIIGEGGTGSSGANGKTFPQFLNWYHFFPSFDYVNPAGIHFGTKAEIRNNGVPQGEANGGNTFYIQQVQGYVSSDRIGEFAFGLPNGALDDLGVGTGDDWGNGLFYSWFAPPNFPTWSMADSYDGDTPRQKLLYESPTFAGFKAGISYQPNDVAINLSTGLTNGNPVTGPDTWAHPQGLARNRIEAVLRFDRTFGPLGVKANIGGAWSGVESSYGGPAYQDVSYGNGGLVLTYAGFELEGSISTGQWNAYCGAGAVAGSCAFSPGGPAPSGSDASVAWDVGFGYNMGPYGIGFTWYDLNFDDLQAGGAVGGHMDHSYGPGIGGSYVVGPGVTLQLDAYTYKTQYFSHPSTNGDIIALTGVFAY